MKSIYRIITFFMIISIAACASSQPNINAANDEDKDIGLGGTGLLAGSGNGLGGTGIVGEITGFGSIFVNGIEIEYHSGTPFTVNGEAAVQSLEIGDVVEVLTTDASKHTQAMMINLRHEIIGGVASVDSKNASFTVLGQTVHQPANKTALPEVGKVVAVSGLRIDDHTVQATRVTTVEGKQKLVRKNYELPFKNRTDRWLVQAHVKNGKADFKLNGESYNIELKKSADEPLEERSGIRILQLKKSTTGLLEVDRVSESKDMPRGRFRPTSLQRSGGNMMQNAVPGSMHIESQPELNRGGR